uniref:thermospermine synthase n=1 Tax=Bicosoecida sp. CB-2014 TaxID=1486930 RepID=A0A7S1CPT3_9STRA
MASDKDEPTMTSAFWFTEDVTPDLATRASLQRILFDAKSEFQRVQIIETGPFGKTLVLDGKTQSALADEYVYHESLVHPAMLAHANPKSVFVGGGGEFATTREILRHPSVEKCVMVDIDKVVCDICREHMPEWHDGCVDDPRLEVYYEDAKAWIEGYDGKFDVIIMDIADPIEAGPGIALYTQEFYQFAITKLNPGGMFVTQSGPGATFNADECGSVINKTLKTAFDYVVPYASDIPSFGSNWAFNIAFNKDHELAAAALAAGKDPASIFIDMERSEVDARIEARIKGGAGALRFYDGTCQRGIFGLPKAFRDVYAKEERFMTMENPVFMY